MSRFADSIKDLQGKKVRFFLGGGAQGYIQGPVMKVEDDLIYIEKEGEIRGTQHVITIHAAAVRFYEFDMVARKE